MARKTYEERKADIQKRIDQLQEEEKNLDRKHKEEERKKRTRRLIEMGGIIESVLGRPTTDEDKIRLENFLKMQERNGSYFSRAMNAGTPQPEDEEA